ncbi:GNAT family N-acetyltransferase [Jiangella aurantiaca]|uniref:GNAT family N-acetyltransferase n=1 Tax=Jiangella aurantiaca TaxID=2530373 RepID=A0A4R5AFI8_9ACTN|nr:GNAT family N-acetyltransferase [Jiangella aurantiaca]TDD71348.1 GNAT family N-acetyltransferase [Jiangella aurantiaca]
MPHTFRAPAEADEASLLQLNNDHALELSEQTADEFRELLKVAWRVRVTDDLTAMVIAFDQDTVRSSQNFDWFKERYPRFAYVDRVVVAPAARGQGLARALYEDVIAAARAEGQTMLCAEVNLDPPNPASDALHTSMGFTPVGSAELIGKGKSVRYYTRPL